MQETAMQTIKNEENVILLAPTGSGKTLGFLLPILEMLDSNNNGIQVLVLSPSRELALQIEQVFKSMVTGFKVNCCYGGHDISIEKNNLIEPPAILIGTPGRIADHLRNGRINTSTIKTMVLDEYDKCLEFGFKAEMSFLISQLNNLSKRIFTSATEAIEIQENIEISKPVVLNFLSEESPDNLKVKVVETPSDDRLNTLFKLVCSIGNRSTLIFCNQRQTVEQISSLLWEKRLANNVFHGGLDQDLRQRTLIKFRNGSHRILVTTDLASRGLDIPEIECVIHFNIPPTESIFTHRNGRTARMHAAGTTYLIISEKETLPPFLKDIPEYEKLPAKVVFPEQTLWVTLYIGAGKKEKISKMDVVGLLMQKGKLLKGELGLIDVLDHATYVAIKRDKIDKLLPLIKNAPIKKQKVKIEVAR
jgi:ATP-independent RNA helicase DbpA